MNPKIKVLILIICLTACTAEVKPIEYPDSLVKAEIAGKIWEAKFVTMQISDTTLGIAAFDSPTLEDNFGRLTVISNLPSGGILPLRPLEISLDNGAKLVSSFENPADTKYWFGNYPSQIKLFIDSISTFNSTFNEYTLAHGRFEAFACNGDNSPICVAPKGTFTNVPVFEDGGQRTSYLLSITANYYKQKRGY